MSELFDIIRRELKARGVVSFARFMELALYYPQLGYYERQSKQIGCQGDFYTSVNVGPLFGELLAFQMIQWLKKLDSPSSAKPRDGIPAFQLVEAGAHDGQLASDILKWISENEPTWLDRIQYWILEPSPVRQRWQAQNLERFGDQVRWFASHHELPPGGVTGVLFSNELLDAFPVHRIGWDARHRRWFEWGVALEDDGLIWSRLPAAGDVFSSPRSDVIHPDVPEDLLVLLPDEFTTELSPAAAGWWRRAARFLRAGWLVTFDYGLETHEFFAPHRAKGTLRAYHDHRLSSDLLARPGEQDLTAHVDFGQLRHVGEREGLVTEFLQDQSRVLTRILAAAASDGTPEWISRSTRQFATLTHPEHLGRPFKALVQARS